MEEALNTQTQEKPKRSRPRYITIAANIAFGFILLIMAFVVFTLVQSRITGEPPNIAGHQMYIVLGGSMSPAFEAGSLAFLKPVDPKTIETGDIITYTSASGGDGLTTHRVMEVHAEEGGLSFTTRGDANDVNDSAPVLAHNIVGRVEFAVPFAGFVMDFAQTRAGLLSLIMIPGALIIIFELRNLFRYAAQWEAQKAQSRPVPGESEQQS